MDAGHPLITVTELRAALDGPEPPTLLDVRWELTAGAQPEAYLARHIPGARFVDLECDLTGPVMGPGGRHPLADPAVFGAAMRRLGVGARRPVVLYDDSGGLPAARAWWQLRDAGHPDARVLDGGLAAWRAADGPTATGEEAATVPGDFEPAPGHLSALDAAGAAALAAGTAAHAGVLFDVRAPERFRGEQEPIDPVAGHIPGARNLPSTVLTGPDGLLRPPQEIAEMLRRAGADRGERLGVYCGSGIMAAHAVLALTSAGIDAALYPGSWSDWISDPARPVATGD